MSGSTSLIEQVVYTAVREALSTLPPGYLGLRSHVLPTESELDACIRGVLRAVAESSYAHSRIIIGSSQPPGLTAASPRLKVLQPDAAAAEATRLRNDDPDLGSGGVLLLYFNTDSTPGEAGLDALSELTSPKVAQAFATSRGYRALEALATSRSRRVLRRLEDASIYSLAAFASVANSHSEAAALPLLGFLPSARDEHGGSARGADEFDALRGIKPARKIQEALEALSSIPQEARSEVGERLRSYLLRPSLPGGTGALDEVIRLSKAALRLATGQPELQALCGLTVELSRLLRRGKAGVEGLVAHPGEDQSTPQPPDGDSPAVALLEEEALESLGAGFLEGELEADSDPGTDGSRLYLYQNDGTSVELRSLRSAVLVQKHYELAKPSPDSFWLEGGALEVDSVAALQTERFGLIRTIKERGLAEGSQQQCPEEVRRSIGYFRKAREVLLMAVESLAARIRESLEDDRAPQVTLQDSLLLLESFPLLVSARCQEPLAEYLRAYEQLTSAAQAGPAAIQYWVANLDIAYALEGSRVEVARLLPTNPLRLARFVLWLRTLQQPPPMPASLAVHYKRTDTLFPLGSEHTYSAAKHAVPSDLGLSAAGQEAARAAWGLLRREDLIGALTVEVVDAPNPAPIVEGFCREMEERFAEDSEVGAGIHISVRCAFQRLDSGDVPVLTRSQLLTSSSDCLATPVGDGVSLTLASNLQKADSLAAHVSIQVQETAYVALPQDVGEAGGHDADLAYIVGKSGNITRIEVSGDSTLDHYTEFLDWIHADARRQGLDPLPLEPVVGRSLLRVLVARGGWPVPPRQSQSLLSYTEQDEHVIAVLAEPGILKPRLEHGLGLLSAAELSENSGEAQRRAVISLYNCRGFLQGLVEGQTDSAMLGLLGTVRAFSALQAESEVGEGQRLVLSLDAPEGRRWVRSMARLFKGREAKGRETRADLIILEAPQDLSKVTRIRVAELKARSTPTELSPKALSRLAGQALTTAARLRACFTGASSTEGRERVGALKRLLWLSAGRQQLALQWQKALAWLQESAAAGEPVPISSECWVVPEQPWEEQDRFTLEVHAHDPSGEELPGQLEQVYFRVLRHLSESPPGRSQTPPAASPGRGPPAGGAPTQASAARTGALSPPDLPVQPSPHASAVLTPQVEAASPSPPVAPAGSTQESGVSPDGVRVVLGRVDSGQPAVWLPNRTDLVNHFNVGITGTMGTGKTQLTKALVAQLVWGSRDNPGGRRPGLLIFDYKGDYQDRKDRFASAIGASVWRPEELPLNPLRPKLPQSRTEFVLMARGFADTLRAIAPQIGAVQRNELIRAVEGCYAEAGISVSEQSSWSRPFPTLRDLSAYLEENELAEGIPQAIIRDLADLGVFASQDPQTDLDEFFDGINVIDLTPLGGTPTVIRAILSFFVNAFYDRMLQGGEPDLEQRQGSGGEPHWLRPLRRLLLVDEADDFVSLNLNSLKNIMQQGRSFGCGVILSTQFLHHFNRTDPPLRPLIGTWILHQMADVTPADYKSLFGLSSREEVAATAARVAALPQYTSLVLGLSQPRRQGLALIRDLPYKDLPTPPTPVSPPPA